MRNTYPDVSPRHGIVYSRIPTVKGSMYGGGDVVPGGVYHKEYGTVLDCVLEMTELVGDANGVSYESAIDQVLKDEGWRIFPTHRKEIIRRLTK